MHSFRFGQWFGQAGRQMVPLSLLCLFWLFYASTALAQSCSVTPAPGNYGPVDVLSGSAVNTSSTFTVTCSGALITVGICIQFDQGSPNSNTSIRYMTNGTTLVQHELYSDANRTVVWGSWGHGATVYGSGGVSYNMTLPVLGGTVSQDFTVYGQFKAGQSTAPPGTYSWSTTSPEINYGILPISCALPLGLFNASAGSSPWTATIGANCNVSTSPVNFGSASLLTANIDATGTVSAQCTSNSPFSIGLDNGANASGGQRRMRLGATSSYVSYNLYTDTGRSQPWSTSGSATACSGGAGSCSLGTGDATVQSVTVYGRVPPQTSPAPGAYADSVVVTVTY
jgi:spore coat protein U-like protein